jgi:hypothetical protein
MADVATPSGAAMFDGGAQEKKKGIEKPEKPSEEAYQAALKKAEKEHAVSMDKFVCALSVTLNNPLSLSRFVARHSATCSDPY